MIIINEERNYRELKESIRMMHSQRSDTERIILIEEAKKTGIDEVIKRNEIINKSFKISNIKQCHLIVRKIQKT